MHCLDIQVQPLTIFSEFGGRECLIKEVKVIKGHLNRLYYFSGPNPILF